MSVINSIKIFEKGNECSRLTITVNNDIRIKIGRDVLLENKNNVIYTLTEAAKIAINNGYNVATMRGEYKNTDTITLYLGGKNRARHSPRVIDLQLIRMLEK